MPQFDLNFKFSSDVAESAFFCNKRNIALNGGFGSGKTYVLCQKVLALLMKFPGYRAVIGRYSATDLKKTTMQTFLKVCPPSLYDPAYGGKKVDAPIPYIDFINGSRLYWMHLDQYDEKSVRSLEVNCACIDQAEEVQESTYIELDNRVGRWDDVEIPADLLAAHPDWPCNPFTGKPMAPAYHIVAYNPPDEGEFSYLYTRFHPESEEWRLKYSTSHAYFQFDSRGNRALPKENLNVLLSRDEEWQDRYVAGNFGRGAGAIHYISPLSLLEVEDSWIRENVLKKGALCRVLDHGASAPTACLWFSTVKGLYFCYREYYKPNDVVSSHRRAIVELSGDETYVRNLADPSIFKKQSEKYGGFWTVADEYADSKIEGQNSEVPPLYWSPADNNEFATRNRINELLKINPIVPHPVTGVVGAPRLYFIKKSPNHPFGCEHVIRETSSQKKKLLAEINGKKIYCDEREEGLADHSYDDLRYFCSSHLGGVSEPKPKARPNSFRELQKRIKAMKILEDQEVA
jgi:hypothetical protein